MLLCLCHHDTCHSRSCIRAGGAETGTGQKNSGHTGNVHKTAICYGTDRGADVSGNEAGTGSGNVQPAEAGGIYTDLLSVWHPSYERGAGFRGERKIFIRERTGGGIYGAAQGVLVLGSGPVETVDGSSAQPAEHIVFPGDYITAVNGKAVTKKEELMERINQYGEQPVVLTLWRGAEQIQVSVEPVEAAEHKGYRLGLWVKDDMAGIGTLTYFDQDGNFGALGHGIGNGQTKDLLRLSDGRLYKAQVLGIKKGVRGTPGELEGVVYYGKDNQIGEVSSNTQIGIYGTLTKNFREEKKNESLLCPVGYKQEIQTKDAVILSDASGELQSYRIVIDDLDYTPGDKNKGIRFHVEDENLLKLTGGIVQGLSGSPILQDGKLIGAVTHVLVNDPTKGYGIFVEEMTANKIGQKT